MVWFIGLIRTIVRGLLRLGWYIPTILKLFFVAYEYTEASRLYIRELIIYIGFSFAKFFEFVKVGLLGVVAVERAIN